MGCGTSKKSSVMPVVESVDEFPPPVDEKPVKTPAPILRTKVHRRPSEAFALQGVDPPVETLAELPPRRRHIGSPLAFEVPVVDEGDSLIRKHPPKRFQRLEDQQVPSANLTHELLDERQAEAEQRRIQLLSQRVQSAKVRPPKRRLVNMEAFDLSEDPIETSNQLGLVSEP